MSETPSKTTGATGELTFWLVLLAVAGVPLLLLVYYLNKGVRDLIDGLWGKNSPIAKAAGYLGDKASQAVTIVDQATNEAATDWGYNYWSAKSGQDAKNTYLLARRAYAEAHGMTVPQFLTSSLYAGWPTQEDWEAGVQPSVA